MSAPRGSIARTSAWLLLLQLVPRTADALLPVLFAAWFGRDDATDVYYFAWALFVLAGSVVFSAFHDSAVVPVLAEVRLRDAASLPVVRGSLFAHTLLLGGASAALVGALAAGWLSVRYAGEPRALALEMIAPLSLYLVALAVKTFFASMLNAEHLYAPLPLAGAAAAAVALAVVAALHGALSVAAIPCGSLAGEIVAAGLLAAFARARGLAVRPTLSRPEPVRRIARLVASEVAGGAVTRVNPVVDQLLAGVAGVAGGGTVLKLSGDVAMAPTTLLQAALLPVLLTHWSQDFAAGDSASLRAAVRRALAAASAILGAAAAALWVGRGPLLRLVFAHGAMDAAGVARMAQLLPYQLAGLVPFGALLVLARAHVAAQNSRLMLPAGILHATVHGALAVALLPRLGLEGIALATSCSHAAVAGFFLFRLGPRLAAARAAPRTVGASP